MKLFSFSPSKLYLLISTVYTTMYDESVADESIGAKVSFQQYYFQFEY